MSASGAAWASRQCGLGLTSIMKFVLVMLVDAGGGSQGEYRVSFSDLGELTLLSQRQVKDALSRLENVGLIVPLVEGAASPAIAAYRLACDGER